MLTAPNKPLLDSFVHDCGRWFDVLKAMELLLVTMPMQQLLVLLQQLRRGRVEALVVAGGHLRGAGRRERCGWQARASDHAPSS